MKRKLLMFFALVFIASGLWAQSRAITGKVTDETGEGLPGVTIQIKGTSQGVFTDADGQYRITVPSAESILVYSFVGFVTQESQVGNRTNINIQLMPSVTSAGELVVVGYGSQIKQDLTGNIVSLKAEQIENTPVPNFQQAIQGRTAGVFIERENGKVGQGIKMRIRGATSITGSNEPLYVIDGVPVTTQSQSSSSSQTSPLADINFNDIESLEILKDASAAAIYGSRGANGVVIITTKKGKAGNTRVNLNIQQGFSRPTGKKDWLNAEEYIELFTEAAYNSDLLEGFDPINNPADYPGSWLQFAEGRFDRYSGWSDWRNNETDTDWQDLAFQDATSTLIDVSASGGSDKTSFYISGSYSDQDGILIGNNFQRTSGRINLDHQATDKLKFGMNLSLARTINDRVADDNAFATPLQLVALAPITPVRDLNGQLYDRPTTTYYNGLIENEDAEFITTVFRNIGAVYATYNVMPGLKVTAEYGIDLLDQNEDRFWGKRTFTGQSVDGQGFSRWVRVLNNTSKVYANFDKSLSNGHDLSVTAGSEYQYSSTDVTSVTGTGFAVDDLKKVASAAEITGGTSTLTQFSFLSYFARVNYKINNKYLFSVSGRVDGSSRFGENERYGFFPAASAGWILSEESFLSDVSAVSFMKLRASYGATGNAGIGNFGHLGLYGGSAYAGDSGLQPTQIPNPDLTWETTKQFNVGIDFGLFEDRISGEIDYYVKNTEDLLLNVPVPGTSGFNSQLQNIGEMENKGFEFVLNTSNVRTTDFEWNTSFNIARNRNRVKALDGDQELIDSGSSRWLNVVKVGESIGVFYGREFAGADPDNGDALWYLNTPGSERETTNDFNAAARVVLGDPNPDWIGGLTNNFRFKDFDLSILLQFVTGNQIYNGGGGFQSANGDWFDNQTRDQLNRWQQPGDITMVPQARLAYGNGVQASSRYLEDGDYLRLKNVTLGYNVPSSVLEKANLRSLRIYMTGINLATFTNYSGWDPEVNTDYRSSNINQGNDFYSAPQAKTLTFGLNVGF